MEIARAVADEVAALERWSEALAEVHERVAHRFRRVEVRERARRYLGGLLARVERKNGWQLAEAMGEADPHGAQRLLNEATWDADDVRDDLACLRHRAPRRRGERRAHRGRDRLPEEGHAVLRRGPPVLRHGRHDGQRAGRGVPRLRLGSGYRLPRSCPLLTACLDA